MQKLSLLMVVALVGTLSACGSSSGRPGRGTGGDSGPGGGRGDGGTSGPPACTTPQLEGTLESCTDGLDNDCDGSYDCSDPSCSGIGECPVCGRVDTQLGSPLPLPDGVGSGMCETNADCSGGERCFELGEDPFPIPGFPVGGNECRESYRSPLDFVGFAADATFSSVSDIVSVCVTMEHSWVRDLQIELEAPGGQIVQLQAFLGRMGGELYMGQADDCDEGGTPRPGVGAMYCWTPTSARPSTLQHANGGGALDSVPSCSGGTSDSLPAGEYNADSDWNALIGTPMNGRWTLSVTDLWGADNGYIFDWSITFNSRNVEDCSSPLI